VVKNYEFRLGKSLLKSFRQSNCFREFQNILNSVIVQDESSVRRPPNQLSPKVGWKPKTWIMCTTWHSIIMT